MFTCPYGTGRSFTNERLFLDHIASWPAIAEANGLNLDGSAKGKQPEAPPPPPPPPTGGEVEGSTSTEGAGDPAEAGADSAATAETAAQAAEEPPAKPDGDGSAKGKKSK